MIYDSDKLLVVLDLAGVLVFAVEGALAAIGGNLDFFGLMVLAFTTALAGGIIRDLLIGAIPPQSLRDWRYGTIAFAGGALVFFLHEFVVRIPSPAITVMDAAALSLFAIAGTVKALDYHMHAFIAILIGRNYGRGRGNGAGYFSRAGSSRFAVGHLRHSGAGRRGGDGGGTKTPRSTGQGGHPGRRDVFRVALGKRVAALEPAARDVTLRVQFHARPAGPKCTPTGPAIRPAGAVQTIIAILGLHRASGKG
jgi:hypothetical protein